MVKENNLFSDFQKKHLLLHFSPFFFFTASKYIFCYSYTYFYIKSLLVLKIIQNSELYMKVFLKFLFHF